MTAFTYRFVPAMRYLRHLVKSGAIGTPWHFARSDSRTGDARPRLAAAHVEAGSGEVGDMLSHRLDFGHFGDRPHHASHGADAAGVGAHASTIRAASTPSDTEDWVGCLAEFAGGVTGVFESVKTAAGYAGGVTSRDWCECIWQRGRGGLRARSPAASPGCAEGRELC